MLNITDNYDVVYNINFKKYTQKKKSKKSIKTIHINNITTLDTETSSGFRQKSGLVIPFSNTYLEKWMKMKKKFAGRDDCPDFLKGDRPRIYKNPISLMSIWQVAFEMNSKDITVCYGRDYESLIDFMTRFADSAWNYVNFGYNQLHVWDQDIATQYRKKGDKIVVHMYVHNFTYDYQFLRNILKFDNVFARTIRKPMRAEVKIQDVTFVFHDTLCLVHKKLAKWAEDENLPVKKAEGKWEYSKLRNPKTPLSADELEYCVDDVVTMIYGLQKYRKKYHNKLSEIPMTQTGEIRQTCRSKISAVNYEWAESCYYIDHSYSFEFFTELCHAFMGGWTHANQRYSDRLLGLKSENPEAFGDQKLMCYDFASSYPSVMTTRRFPVSQFREIDEQRLRYLEMQDLHSSNYRYLVKVRIHDFYSLTQNTFFSSSKCILPADDKKAAFDKMALKLDNGKINAGKVMVATMTDLDWDIFKKTYQIGSYEILKAWEADADYLPAEMILTILDYFAKKTSFKDVAGKESQYTESKQWINSIYGVMVTKVITDEILYDDKNGWSKKSITEEDFIKKMSIPENPAKIDKGISESFTTYQAGVWVTAWARHNLWDAILHLDRKTVYCDTDSIKGFFDDTDQQWFDDYNKNVVSKLQEEVANHYGFSIDKFKALTPKKVEKQLGIFAQEYGDGAVLFKTLGAKRYCIEWYEKGEHHIETTIAGLSKKCGLKLIKSAADLNNGLYWSPSISEKLMAHFSDTKPGQVYQESDWVDSYGNWYHSKDKFGIMLEPTGFDLSLADEYNQLLRLLAGQPDSDYFDITKCLRDFYEDELDFYDEM